MRITKVDIKNWRILHEPEALFQSSCAVIIGENGSGKSTLLEMILTVFELVYKRLKDPNATADTDGFFMEYETTDKDDGLHKVSFESGYWEDHEVGDLHITIDGSPYAINEDGGEKLKALLPANIITYYAGDTDRVMNLCNYFIAQNLNAVRKSGNKYTLNPPELPTDVPFIYSDLRHLSIALMALIANDGESRTLDKLNLKEESVVYRINLQKPRWATAGSDELWGNSSQLFNDFLSGLIEHALQNPQTSDAEINIEISAMNLRDYLDEIGIEHRGVFLYQIFDLLYNNDLLKNVEVWWNRRCDEMGVPPMSADYFSEGEKQVLMTSAMIEFWDKKHCLFLFDEPDTFLHPKWQSQFLPEVTQRLKESQAIITTHSPLMLSSVASNCELFIMKEGKLYAYGYSTYGADAGDILETAMETTPRDSHVDEVIKDIENDIRMSNFDEAKRKLSQLEETGISVFNKNRLRSTIERLELLGV